jgi:hypothetical protein
MQEGDAVMLQRTKMVSCILLLLVGAVVGPAWADLKVFVQVTKDKDVVIVERLAKFKFVTIGVFGDFHPDGAAEAEALANVRNEDNTVDDNVGGTSTNFGIERNALIKGSVNDNTGIVGVNQDVGNMVNQANIVAVAATDTRSAFTDAQAAVDQINQNNFSRQEERFDRNDPDRTSVILGSVNNNSGIIGVNQNAGNMNNQTNAVALAVGIGSQVALAESVLGQVNTGNRVFEVETFKEDRIAGSVNANTGIVGVNQSSGNMNNQASAISFSAITSTVVVTTP